MKNYEGLGIAKAVGRNMSIALLVIIMASPFCAYAPPEGEEAGQGESVGAKAAREAKEKERLDKAKRDADAQAKAEADRKQAAEEAAAKLKDSEQNKLSSASSETLAEDITGWSTRFTANKNDAVGSLNALNEISRTIAAWQKIVDELKMSAPAGHEVEYSRKLLLAKGHLDGLVAAQITAMQNLLTGVVARMDKDKLFAIVVSLAKAAQGNDVNSQALDTLMKNLVDNHDLISFGSVQEIQTLDARDEWFWHALRKMKGSHDELLRPKSPEEYRVQRAEYLFGQLKEGLSLTANESAEFQSLQNFGKRFLENFGSVDTMLADTSGAGKAKLNRLLVLLSAAQLDAIGTAIRTMPNVAFREIYVALGLANAVSAPVRDDLAAASSGLIVSALSAHAKALDQVPIGQAGYVGTIQKSIAILSQSGLRSAPKAIGDFMTKLNSAIRSREANLISNRDLFINVRNGVVDQLAQAEPVHLGTILNYLSSYGPADVAASVLDALDHAADNDEEKVALREFSAQVRLQEARARLKALTPGDKNGLELAEYRVDNQLLMAILLHPETLANPDVFKAATDLLTLAANHNSTFIQNMLINKVFPAALAHASDDSLRALQPILALLRPAELLGISRSAVKALQQKIDEKLEPGKWAGFLRFLRFIADSITFGSPDANKVLIDLYTRISSTPSMKWTDAYYKAIRDGAVAAGKVLDGILGAQEQKVKKAAAPAGAGTPTTPVSPIS